MVRAASVFALALQVPFVSALAFITTGALECLRAARLRRLTGLLARVVLLAGALGTYYAVAADHGIVDGAKGVGYAVTALAAYVTGYMTSRAADPAATTRNAMIAGILGFALFGLLCVAVSTGADIAARKPPHLWDRTEIVNATALGGMTALGFSQLGSLLFWVRTRARGFPAALAAIIIAVASGAYTNLLLRNRGPILGAGVAVCAAAWMYARSDSETMRRKFVRIALVAAMVGIGLVAFTWLSQFEALQRFQAEGLETARYDLWTTVLGEMWNHPWGGRQIPIPELYVHNLWLDVAWDAGPLACLLLVAFHVAHLAPAWTVFRSRMPDGLQQVLGMAGIALLVTSVSEPVLAFPIAYFAFSCLYLGAVLGHFELVRAENSRLKRIRAIPAIPTLAAVDPSEACPLG
jgi:hypothetical protein